MNVTEIFTSLQGEGYHTGTVATFIRFSGCNLRCPFCDTDHSTFTQMSEDEIVDRVELGSFVVLTGGEPSLQVTASLIDKLHDKGCYVAIETNGTHAIPDNIDWITCSPKEDSKPILAEVNEVKVVYTRQDVERWRMKIHAPHWFLQPCDTPATLSSDTTPEGMNTREVIDYILEHPWWRLSLQTHKLLGIQ